MEVLTQVGVALFLAWLNERLIERYLGRPLEENLPNVKRWWLIYPALGLGFMWSWVFGVNIICWTGAPELPGRVLSAILVGSGSELIHKVIEWVKVK